MERLTVLFTDLVDSTSRRVRSGEEAAHELRQHHDRLLRVAILSNAGTVAKHTGDGVMATFAGASDAINAAVLIQQAIDFDNSSNVGPEPLQVRIGISVDPFNRRADTSSVLAVVRFLNRKTGTGKVGALLTRRVTSWSACLITRVSVRARMSSNTFLLPKTCSVATSTQASRCIIATVCAKTIVAKILNCGRVPSPREFE